MSALEAARLGDEISHSWAWLGFIIGGIAGAAVGCIVGAELLALAEGAAALAFATSETVIGAVFFGAIALDLTAMAVGVAYSMTAQGATWGEYIGESIKSITGKIVTGSGDTFVEFPWLGAARAVADLVGCGDPGSGDPGIVTDATNFVTESLGVGGHGYKQIAQGSSTVFVNGFHFSRRTEKTVCDARIENGCSTVIVGGDTVTLLTIQREVPEWAEKAKEYLGYQGYELSWWSTYLLLGEPGVWFMFEAMPWVSQTLSDLVGRGCRSIGVPEPITRTLEVAAQALPYVLLGRATKEIGERISVKSGEDIIPNKLNPNEQNRFVYREDSDMFSSEGKQPGWLKSHVDSEGNVRPANPEGDATIQQHVRGSQPAKSDSPYTSFKDAQGTGKSYGGDEMSVDLTRLQQDINSGKIKGVKIVENEEVLANLNEAIDQARARYENNPTAKNQERLDNAHRDYENAARDHEVLIKGIIPKDYVTIFKR